jgi:hypothetical protein
MPVSTPFAMVLVEANVNDHWDLSFSFWLRYNMGKVLKSFTITDLFNTAWQDLTTEEIFHAMEAKAHIINAKAKGDPGSAGHWYIMLLRALRKNKNAVSKMNVEQVVDCVNDILFSPKSQVDSKKTPLAKPWYFFPTINHTDFTTPADHLQDRSFAQLMFADSYFSKFFIQDYYDKRAFPPQDPTPMSESYINDMIAVLYVTSDKFNESGIQKNSELISLHIKDYERSVFLHSYANVKQFIVDGCPNLFIKPENEEEEIKDKPPVDSEPMWQDLLFDLSETPAYQGMLTAKKAPIYEALNYLEKKAKENKPKLKHA